jgi:hypothetical protein
VLGFLLQRYLAFKPFAAALLLPFCLPSSTPLAGCLLWPCAAPSAAPSLVLLLFLPLATAHAGVSRCCTWRAYFAAAAQAASLCAGAAALITAWASSLSNPAPSSRAPLLQSRSAVEDRRCEPPEAAAASLTADHSGPRPSTVAASASSPTDPRCSPTPVAAPATFGPSPRRRFFSTCTRRLALVAVHVQLHCRERPESTATAASAAWAASSPAYSIFAMGCQPMSRPAGSWAWPDLAQSAQCTLFLSSELFDSNSS